MVWHVRVDIECVIIVAFYKSYLHVIEKHNDHNDYLYL